MSSSIPYRRSTGGAMSGDSRRSMSSSIPYRRGTGDAMTNGGMGERVKRFGEGRRGGVSEFDGKLIATEGRRL